MTPATSIKKNIRALETPEGVPLHLELATYGERGSALMIDLLIMLGAFLGVFILGGIFLSWTNEFLLIFLLLAFFAIRSFYFIFFEIRWQGRTPGKKVIGLRVIDRKGGVLEPEAIFARNLMRELELWLPMMLFFVQAELGIEKALLILNAIWMGIFVFFPLFNKDRLRAGDLIAGTLVIKAPKVSLLSDPVNRKRGPFETAEQAPVRSFSFTPKQLGVYGVYELQTLEGVLRSQGKDQRDIFETVAAKIAEKINWDGETFYGREEEFLRDFYAAMRQHQEGRLLFGKRKKDKFDSEGRPPENLEEKVIHEEKELPSPEGKAAQRSLRRKRRR